MKMKFTHGPYIAKKKSAGKWYISGPGRGEPKDEFCDPQETVELLCAEMNVAYKIGYREHQHKVAKSLDKIFDLNMEV